MTTAQPSASLPRPLVAVLSSGFFGFFAHAGFLQGLSDLGIEPDAYAGSSSGALVAVSAAAGMSPQQMLASFRLITKEDFWDPPGKAGLLKAALQRFRGFTGYVRGRAFIQLLESHLPVKNFEELSKPALVSTLDLTTCSRRIISSGPLAPAVAASGAVPMLFEPVEIGGNLLLDGGLVDKAPITASFSQLDSASQLIHLLPSSSLEAPLEQALSRTFTPFRLERRGVDAAREQVFWDQMDAAKSAGVVMNLVHGLGYPRCGPGRLQNGPQAFEAARSLTRKSLRPQT